MDIGTPLSGRYRLQHRIAAGGMGEVWQASDETLRRPVAVKLLRPEYASDAQFLERFRGEARHTARLSHPGIASVYDYGEVAYGDERPTAYLVMELVEGEPLSAMLARDRRLPVDRTLDLMSQVGHALHAAHGAGVIHRDVKPGNLLLRPDGAIKVTDFGIARAVDAAPLTATGIMMGTAYYVSPEQASGRPVTPASDVYSLGIVAYECLAGRRPFNDRNPITVVMAHQQEPPPPLPNEVPAPVRELIGRALAKEPGARPRSAEALALEAEAVRRSLRGGGAPAPVAAPARQRNAPAAAAAPRPPAVDPRRPAARDDRGRGGGRLIDRPLDQWPAERADPSTRAEPALVSTAPEPAERPHAARARSAGSSRRISWPVFVVALVVIAAVVAVITRSLAGDSGSSGAPAPDVRGTHAVRVPAATSTLSGVGVGHHGGTDDARGEE